VVFFYGNDFSHKDHLEAQLIQLHAGSEQELRDLPTVVDYLQSLSTAERNYFSEVVKLAKLMILVMPATNATSERTFSALKTWLRTTCQVRLNWCMMLHVHKERTDALSMLSVANEFVSRNDTRLNMFGHFTLYQPYLTIPV